MKGGFVYILASDSGTLYTGVTNNLLRRVWEHRIKINPTSFTAKYDVYKLVYFEQFGEIGDAIRREKQIKNYRREKKQALIRSMNPGWRDLYERMDE